MRSLELRCGVLPRQIIEHTGKKVPYGWKVSLVNIEEPTYVVEPLDLTLASGVQMRLNYTFTRLGPAQLAITERLLLNETRLRLLALQSFTTYPPGKVLLGARVTDGTHLPFALSSLASQETVATYTENTTVTIPITPFVWSSVSLDTESIWRSQGWSEPNTVDFSLYIEANFYGYYYANIKEISLASS